MMELLDEFYDKIIENFLYPENYYIVIIHGAYDIPKKASDGIEMFDASDDVYEFLLCSICPVKLTKPGLCYNEDTNTIEERIRDWFVEVPVTGFLFPAFTDRNTDIHSVLYYSKNPEELNADFARLLLGCELPLSASSQKETFNTLISETLQGECTYETVKTIHQELNDLLDERKDDPNPPALDKNDVKRLLLENGATEETLEHFEEEFEQSRRKQPDFPVRFKCRQPTEIRDQDAEHCHFCQTGMCRSHRNANARCRPYFVIPADDSVEVNGIPVHTMQRHDEGFR